MEQDTYYKVGGEGWGLLQAAELTRLTNFPQEWHLEYTGGGCTALVLKIDPKEWAHYFMVTLCDEPSVPKPNEPHHLGEYVNEDQDINHWYFPNRRSMVAFLRSWKKHQTEIEETK